MKKSEILLQLDTKKFKEKISNSRKNMNVIEFNLIKLPYFENKNRTKCYTICDDGENIVSIEKTEKIICPFFNIETKKIKIDDFKNINDLINKEIDLIIEREQLCFNALISYINGDSDVYLLKKTDICIDIFEKNDNADSICVFECISMVSCPKGELLLKQD